MIQWKEILCCHFSDCQFFCFQEHGRLTSPCALGIAACRNFIKVRYVRLPDLLNELAVAHGDGTLKKVIKAYQKIDLLILDEFLLSPVSTEQTRELLEIIEARSVKGSVILPFFHLKRKADTVALEMTVMPLFAKQSSTGSFIIPMR